MPDLTAQFATEDGRDDLPDVLLKAADVLAERGWLQGDFFDLETAFVYKAPIERCAVCVRGALNVAAGFYPTGPDGGDERADGREDAVDALAFHLGYDPDAQDGGEGPAWFVSNWNDYCATSPEQVITVLRECAAELKAGA